MKKLVMFQGYEFEIWFTRYTLDDSICIALKSDDAGWFKATTCIGYIVPEEGHVMIKNYSENEGILEVLVKAGVISPSITKYSLSQFAEADLCKLLVQPVFGKPLEVSNA